jgi:hypothetical protein
MFIWRYKPADERRFLAKRGDALKARGGRSDQQPVARPRALLDLSLLGDLERIVDLYAEVSNGAFKPLDCSQ